MKFLTLLLSLVPSVSASTSCSTYDGVDDACACNSDAKAYCPTEWSSRSLGRKLALVTCLRDHEASLSDACVASLDRRLEASDAVNSACATARVDLCSGVAPAVGSDYGNTCLQSHATQLAADYPDCYDALETFLAMDPVR